MNVVFKVPAPRLIGGLCVLLVVVTLPACVKNSAMAPDANPRQAGAEVPADLQMMCGTGGGFAGRMSGYTIDATGAVSEWEGRYPGENVRRQGALASNDVAALWREVEAIGFFDHRQQEEANLTAFLSVRAGERSNRVTWGQPLGEAPGATPIHALYAACVQAARGALGEE